MRLTPDSLAAAAQRRRPMKPRISTAPCYYAGCGGRVRLGRDNLRHLGRCENCAVVMVKQGRRWRTLTPEEWADVGRAAVVSGFTQQSMRERAP